MRGRGFNPAGLLVFLTGVAVGVVLAAVLVAWRGFPVEQQPVPSFTPVQLETR